MGCTSHVSKMEKYCFFHRDVAIEKKSNIFDTYMQGCSTMLAKDLCILESASWLPVM